MAAAASLVFFKLEILTVCPPYRANLRQHAKVHQNRSHGCGDIAIFVIFKMAAAAILVFEKFEILTTCPL